MGAQPSSSEELASGLPSLIAESATTLVPAALEQVLVRGHRVEDKRSFIEVLNQSMCQRDSRRRVLSSPKSSFNPAVAVARLVWHLGARSDLASISFYEPRAARFSDDGVTLTGSNYGARLFGASGGPEQVEGLLSRLRANRSSRRAMAIVWEPEDAVRASQDIPCALAIACYVRDEHLLTTVTMRSNNALRLLPYNIFEFSMLAEMIAAELQLPLGPYWHSANSLHVFEDEVEPARELVASPAEIEGDVAMPPMPRERPFSQAERLVEHEERLRRACELGNMEGVPRLLERAAEDLDPYWLQLFAVLVLFCIAKEPQKAPLDPLPLLDEIPEALRTATERALKLGA